MRMLFLSRRFPPIYHLFPIMHLIYLPKFCITFVFHFSWVLQSFQQKLKPMLLQNFGGQMRCIIGDVQKAYSPQICHRSKLAEKARENALLGLGKNGCSSRIRHPNALTERTWGDAAHGLEKYNRSLTLG